MPSQPRQPLQIYQASAGAGKTYTLVREYLRLALQQPDGWSRILAVTFTRKATAELKTRVVRQLGALASNAPGAIHLSEDLQKGIETDLFTREGASAARGIDVTKAARSLLQQLLHDFDALGIQTLDAFFLRIVKAFFFEINRQTAQHERIQAGFEVELDSKPALAWATAKMLSGVGIDPVLTALLEKRVEAKLAEEGQWDITTELESLSDHLLRAGTDDPFNQHLPDDLELKEGLAQLESYSESLTRAVAANANACLQAFATAGVQPTDFKVGNAKVGKAIEQAKNCAFEHFTEAQLRHGGVPSTLLTFKKPHTARDQALADAGLIPAYAELAAAVRKAQSHVPPIRYIRTHAMLLPLLAYLRGALQLYRLERQVLLMQDVGQLLSVIVRDTPVPFIYEKVGTRYRHYFLDEFQDTSRQQWQNLQPLVENALAENGRSLLVGDVKQAIYRWRGGDQDLLPAVADQYASRAEALVLAHNYRSGGQLVAFSNHFFDAVLEVLAQQCPEPTHAALLRAYDARTRHQTVPSPEREALGYVEIRPKAIPTEGVHRRDRAAYWVTQYFLPLWDELRQQGFALKDIALLVRKNSAGKEYGSALVAAGIPVVSADALVVSASSAVQHVMSAVRWLLTPTDTIAAAHLRLVGQQPIHNILVRDADVPAPLRAAATRLRRRPLEQGLTELCHLLGYAPANDPFLLRLLALAEQVGAQQGGWGAFLRAFEDEGDRLTVETEQVDGAVSLLTVHKAKGLEFPVVIVPEANWDLLPKSQLGFGRQVSPYWGMGTVPPFNDLRFPLPIKPEAVPKANSPFYEKQLEEAGKTLIDELNTLYVALTRAIDRLFVFYTPPRSEPGSIAKANDLLQVLLAAGGPLAGGFDTERERYCFGNPASGRIGGKEPSATEARPLVEAPLRATEPGQAIRRQAERFSAWHTPAEVATGPTARLRGQRIHALLASIRTLADLPKALEAACQAGWLSRAEVPALEEALTEVISHEAVAPAFDPAARLVTERALLVPNGPTLRPDRVALHPNATWVIEFKTGAPTPAHSQQLATYLGVVAQAGLPSPTGRLVYLDPIQVVSL